MSTVKISQLPNLTRLDSNTSNTILIGIDKSTSVTGQFTAKVLADGLYANTPLNVGNNQITFPGTVAQFAGNNENYIQINLQNKNGSGSSDYVVTANNGTDVAYYGDFGIAGSTDTNPDYSAILPLDTYLYAQGNGSGDPGGNLVIGTATIGKTIKFIAGGTEDTDYVAQLSTNGLELLKKPLFFADGTSQNTSATISSFSAESFANSAFLRANSGYNQANSGSSFANGAFGQANSAASFANGSFLQANASYSKANSGASFANGAFEQANTGASFANGAFDKANSAASFANGAFGQANSAASFANGAFVTSNSAASFANGAFTVANTISSVATSGASFANGAFARANSGYEVANNGSSFANGAFSVANSASSNTITTQGVDLTQNTNITSAQSFANGAFTTANSAASFANGAFTTANSTASFANGAFDKANSAASFANGAFTSANSGWSKANSAYSLAGTQAGRLDVLEPIAQEAFTIAYSALDLSTANSAAWLPVKANSTSVFANAAFDAANSGAVFANASFLRANASYLAQNTTADFANGAFITANASYIAQNTTAGFSNGAFITANASYIAQNTTADFANAAFVTANSAHGVANTGSSFANGAFVSANSGAIFANAAFTRANSAYAKANSALANTSGTFDGSLSITGDLSLLNGSISSAGNMRVNGTIVMANSNFSATEAALTIKATANVALPSNDGYMLHISGKQNVASRIVFDSYSVTGNAYAVVAGRTARGTVDAPLPVANGDVLMRVSGNGRGDTSWASLGVARMDIVATENYTDAARGSQIQFWNCQVGSNTLQQIATFNGDSVDFTGVVKPEKGFIYTPRVPAGNQTAITINYATDSMIKANLVADLTVSHSNFITGKVVEMWLVNTGGVGRTVTHGISATNSTTNSTTFTIAGTSSAYLRFFSIDGDLANTFVSVVYA